MNISKHLAPLKRITRSLHLHFFLLGILLCLLFWFRTESAYETEIFDNIHSKLKKTLPANMSKDSFALAAMHMTHFLQERRNVVFGHETFESIKYKYLHPITVDLMTGNGYCGSYTSVLARILKSDGMQVRIGQMEVKGSPAGHIYIETLTESGWIVMDPLFKTVFITPAGHFATYDDLHNNWNYYKKQAPSDYDSNYKFEGVRYTNWNKLGFVTRGCKSILNLVLGKERADKISVRTYMLRIYNKLSWIVMVLLIIVAYRTYRIYRKRMIERG